MPSLSYMPALPIAINAETLSEPSLKNGSKLTSTYSIEAVETDVKIVAEISNLFKSDVSK